jgi:glycosyltransferase 2 family protein
MSDPNYLRTMRDGIRRLIYWKWFGVLNSAVVLALLFIVLARRVESVDLAKILPKVELGWLMLALVMGFATVVVASFRTNDIFTRELGRPLGLVSVVRLQFVALFMTFAMPIAVAADVARVGMFRMRYGLGFELCTRAIIFDRIVGALGIVLVGVLTAGLQLLLFDEPRFLVVFQLVMLAGAIVFISVLAALARWRIEMSREPLQLAAAWMSALGKRFREPDFVVRQSAFMLLYVAGVCATMLLLSWGLGFAVSLLLLIAFTPVILFVNNLPFLYAGWGGRELITVVTLSQIGGMQADSALVLSVSYGLVMLVVALPGAVFWMVRPTFRKAVKSEPFSDQPFEQSAG